MLRSSKLLSKAGITLAWGFIMATVTLAFVFQGYFVPGLNLAPLRDQPGQLTAYALFFAVAVLAGMVLMEISDVVGSFFIAMGVAAIVEYVVLMLPSMLDIIVLGELAGPAWPNLVVAIVVYSLFPIPLFIGFAGSMIGAFLGERYLD